MGCGASASRNVSSHADEIDPLLPNENLAHILLASHSSERSVIERIRQDLLNEGFSCELIDENTPRSLSNRAKLIEWCDLFVVMIGRLYQRTFTCMEALNYAKDTRKPIVSILAEVTFRPYGALGAISASAIQCVVIKQVNTVPRTLSKIARTQVKLTRETSLSPKVISVIPVDQQRRERSILLLDGRSSDDDELAVRQRSLYCLDRYDGRWCYCCSAHLRSVDRQSTLHNDRKLFEGQCYL